MNRFRTSLSVIVVVVLGVTSAHADTIAHWNFEEGSADTAASTASGSILDVSGNGLNGTAIGGPIYRSNALPSSTLGLEFSGGRSNRVFVQDNALFALTESLTVEAWIRLDGAQAGSLNQLVFRGDSRGGLDPYYLAINGSNEVVWHIESMTTGSNVTSSSLEFGRYYHIAGTLDDITGAQSLYIDGVLVNSTTTSVRPLATLGPFFGRPYGISFGSLQDGSGQWFNGVIDEVRISNTALGSSDFPGAVPEPSSLLLCSLGALGMCLYRRRRS